jgi:hypothetical protein
MDLSHSSSKDTSEVEMQFMEVIERITPSQCPVPDIDSSQKRPHITGEIGYEQRNRHSTDRNPEVSFTFTDRPMFCEGSFAPTEA